MTRRSTRLSTGSVLPKSYASSSETESESEAETAEIDQSAELSVSESESDEDEQQSSAESELGFGEKPTRAQIAKRRNKTRKLNAQAKKEKAERDIIEKGTVLYSRFSNLPYEVLMQILSFLPPFCLMALSRTCKQWYGILTSRERSQRLWQKSFDYLTFTWQDTDWIVPKPPSGFYPPYYAAFLFACRCMVCDQQAFDQANCARHLLTLCRRCFKVLYLTKQGTKYHLAAYGKRLKYKHVFDACVSYTPKRKALYYWYEIQSKIDLISKNDKYSNPESKAFKRLAASTQELQAHRDGFAQDIRQWLMQRNSWQNELRSEYHECNERHLLALKERIIIRIQQFDDQAMAKALQTYIQHRCIDVERWNWARMARLESELGVAELMQEHWLEIHQSAIVPYEQFYAKQLQITNEWQAEERLRQIIKPWYLELKEALKATHRVWPAFFTFLNLDLCKDLRDQLRGDPHKPGEDILACFQEHSEAILTQVNEFFGSYNYTASHDHIWNLIRCHSCWSRTLTIHDIETHPCFIFSHKDPEKWRPRFNSVRNTIADRASMTAATNDEEAYIGRKFNSGMYSTSHIVRIRLVQEAIGQIIPSMPLRHSLALPLIFKCETCERGSLGVHSATDYRTIINLYVQYFEKLGYQECDLLEQRIGFGLRNSFYWMEQLRENHLVWKEVDGDGNIELTDSENEDSEDYW